jgi:methyl-accepting chemotaxis protein
MDLAMSEINPERFGELRAEVASQRREIDRMAVALEQMTAALNEIKQTMSEARGGWRAIAYVAGISSTFTGALTWIISHFRWPHP